MTEEEISPEVASYIEKLNKELEGERVRRMGIENQLGQISAFNPGKESNIVEYQLDLNTDLDKIFHLLSGHEIKVNKGDNSQFWAEPTDDRLKIFSDYGVKMIMNLLSMYLNRNTLMGFYDEETIKWKVKDFGIELSDLFLTRYEFLLHYPSPEDLFEKYKPIVSKQKLNITDKELYEKCLAWSNEEMEEKGKHLPIIHLSLTNMVHSTYTRAFLGKEKTSLGERGINISQNNAQNLPAIPEQKRGGLFSFGK